MSFRRILLLGMVLVVAVAGGVWLRGRPGNYVNFPPTATGPWVALGDSLTKGFMSDAIHPNEQGYQRIAERSEKELRPLLPQL